MSDAVRALEPRTVWDVFAGMAGVPRPSKREDRIQAHMLALAEERGLEARRDATGNIVVRVPASPGREAAPTVVLQGHLDMVCEKNAGTEHDFDSDPIRLRLERGDDGPWVTADGTTLGADNGIGVALAWAVATDPDAVHGPLELLLTCDEEQGMTGAQAVTADSFAGRILINLDSEEDASLYIGCAGAADTTMHWSFAVEPAGRDGGADGADGAGGEALRVAVRGLRGGHSGCDIHENRGNAIQTLARALADAAAAPGGALRIGAIRGGNLRNAIPREASAVVRGDRAALADAAERIAHACRRDQFEDDVEIAVEPANAGDDDAPAGWISAGDTRRLLDALLAIPSGVISMHPKIPTLVQNSNNLSVLTCAAGDGGGGSGGGRLEIVAECLSRAAATSLLHFDKARLAAIARATGGSASHSGQYPGWEPDVDSKLLAICREVYRETFGREPEVKAIHAGLECGIIGAAIGEPIDMISFGPDITGAHSPDERVSVESVARVETLLRAVLERLAA